MANRLLSGTAEGMASGADGALVFDSLVERGREREWLQVLDQVTCWQSAWFVLAMLVSGAVYDQTFLNRVFGTRFGQETGQRFPIYLNLLSALATLTTAVRLREPGTRQALANPEGEPTPGGREAGSPARRWPCS